MRKLVTTTHLEMTSRSELARAAGVATSLQIVRAELPSAELNRFLYTAVGARWMWYTRLPWSYDRWLAWVDRPELETWAVRVLGRVGTPKDAERLLALYGTIQECHIENEDGEIVSDARRMRAAYRAALKALGKEVNP